ncbi:probable protein ABIL5 [Malania oleifera]|uniref:probable protein ABIL5 n=1 Tax=Malania oleifera TaxID=397392 RepID=UPI0025AE2D62|nr:probable protein ABIL5 [Malania oleifera]
MAREEKRKMMASASSSCNNNLNAEAESQDALSFHKSLQELKDLRSQLHYAADYSETKFLRAEEKKIVMEDTKEYICKAVVAVVDHLGTIAADLDSQLSKTNSFSDADLRIICLNQRLAMCQEYAHNLDIARVRWSTILPRHYPQYISTYAEKSGSEPCQRFRGCNTSLKQFRESDKPSAAKITTKREFQIEKMSPLLCRHTHKPSQESNSSFGFGTIKWHTSLTSVLPVPRSLPTAKFHPTFHFQSAQKVGRRSSAHRKSFLKNDILSLLGWNKQPA